MTVLLDNEGKGQVGDALVKSIKTNARLAIASGFFSIYGYSALKSQFTNIGTLRLLIPSGNEGVFLTKSEIYAEIC